MYNVPLPPSRLDAETLRAYLYQLATVLREASAEHSENTPVTVRVSKGGATDAAESARASFNAIKSLIITSADVIEAFGDEIERRLSGKYVAHSEFGSFEEESERLTSENAKRTEDLFRDVQRVTSNVAGISSALVEVNARLRTGLLYYNEEGVPVYGVEIGQRTAFDGEEHFNQYARFTADRLSFFDRNGTEVAYVGDEKLFVCEADVARSLGLGGYRIGTDAGLVFRWEGT